MKSAFIRTLARDRAIAANELAFIEQLAYREAVPDEDERLAVNRILRRISREMVPADIWLDMERFKRSFGVYRSRTLPASPSDRHDGHG